MLVMAYGHSYKLPFITTRGNNVYGECRDVLINWCSSWQSGSPAYIGVWGFFDRRDIWQHPL